MVGLALSAGWPALALGAGPRLALLLGFSVALTAGLALVTARAMAGLGRPLRARRDLVLAFLIYGVIVAALSPVAAASFSGAIGTQGYDLGMAFAMWPLGVMLGAPVALFAGLAFSLVMFIKPPGREADLEAAALPRQPEDDGVAGGEDGGG